MSQRGKRANTIHSVCVKVCRGPRCYNLTEIFFILLVEWTLCTPNYANMGAGWLIVKSTTVGALYCPIGSQDWNDPFYNLEGYNTVQLLFFFLRINVYSAMID